MIADLTDTITCVIVEDHPAVAQSVARLFEDRRISVRGMARDASEGLMMVADLRPTIAVVDLGLRGVDGLELTRRITAVCPETSVLIYSGNGSPALLFEARDAGARGFILKESPLDDLLRAVDIVSRGGTFVDPVLGDGLVSSRRQGHQDLLTGRQVQIVRLMAKGERDLEIASHLCISVETVRAHIKRAMSRLGVSTRPEAIAAAFRRSLIS